MTSVPDKINVKRRRDEDPVDTLIFATNKKQRTTDDIFVRLRPEDGQPLIKSILKPSNIAPKPISSGSNHGSIPEIRTTKPGDEIKDFEKYKAAQDAKLKPVPPSNTFVTTISPKPIQSIKTQLISPSALAQARQFHLTRDLSTTLRPQSSGGIRKSKTLRPHLPTFIERLEKVTKQQNSIYAEPPVDRIIKSINQSDQEEELHKILASNGNVSKTNVQTFQKPKSNIPRTGRSIRDDPATWDLRSDQLADELLALALDMDPTAKEAYNEEVSLNSRDTTMNTRDLQAYLDQPDDYVFETYVRVQPTALQDVGCLPNSITFGYLVIDESEEDLWEQYLREEDEDSDDWDGEDEDSNAEDNPNNEYPDDEISSDDEVGNGVYKYRRNCSDDEQFDGEDDD